MEVAKEEVGFGEGVGLVGQVERLEWVRVWIEEGLPVGYLEVLH